MNNSSEMGQYLQTLIQGPESVYWNDILSRIGQNELVLEGGRIVTGAGFRIISGNPGISKIRLMNLESITEAAFSKNILTTGLAQVIGGLASTEEGQKILKSVLSSHSFFNAFGIEERRGIISSLNVKFADEKEIALKMLPLVNQHFWDRLTDQLTPMASDFVRAEISNLKLGYKL
jgi:hypothetical protein